MIIDALKLSLLTYFKHMGLYDYLAFIWLFVTFFVLIVLAIIVAKRSSVAALLLIIFALILFTITPLMIEYKLNSLLRTTSTEVSMVKKLVFSDSLIVEANIYNHASKPFNICLVHTYVTKQTNATGIKALPILLKPIAVQSILVRENIQKDDFINYKAVFDDFTYTGEVNATVKAECY